MPRVEEIRVAAFEKVWSARRDGHVPPAAVQEFVSSWRLAPLVEFAREIETAEEIEQVVEALVEARVVELREALIEAGRDAIRGWAYAAALEPAA